MATKDIERINWKSKKSMIQTVDEDGHLRTDSEMVPILVDKLNEVIDRLNKVKEQ